MPSDSKSVRSAKSARSTKSTRSRETTRSHHDQDDYAVTSDDDSVPLKATFSHRSKRSSTHSQESKDNRSVHEDFASDEEEDEVQDNLDEDSTSSVLMSNKNVTAQKQPSSGKGAKSARIEEARDEEGQAGQMDHGSFAPTDRSRILKDIETRAVNRRESNTVHMGNIIDSLENALYAAKNLDNLNMLEQMEAWRDKATAAENRMEEMAEEIASLKKEASMWQGRTRRAEKRCERIQSGMEDNKVVRKNSRGMSSVCPDHSLANDVSIIMSEDDAEALKRSNPGLKTVLRGTSFRQKWDRKRIAGIEEEIKVETSDGESTVAAREYVDQYLEYNQHVLVDSENRDASLVRVSSPSRRPSMRSNNNTKKSAQRLSMTRLSQHQALVPQTSSLEDNNNSWVEMLSI